MENVEHYVSYETLPGPFRAAQYLCRADLIKIIRGCLERYERKEVTDEDTMSIVNHALSAMEALKELESENHQTRSAMTMYLVPTQRKDSGRWRCIWVERSESD